MKSDYNTLKPQKKTKKKTQQQQLYGLILQFMSHADVLFSFFYRQ